MALSEANSRDTQIRTIVTVRWALILTCAYLMLLGPETSLPSWLGPLLVALYLASNLFVGRSPGPDLSQAAKVCIALVDSVFIAASLWVAGQLSVELMLLCLGVLILAIAGLSLGVIAAVTLGMAIASLLVGWATNSELILQSGVLLRVPFLLGAAMVFAQLVRGSGGGAADVIEATGEGFAEHVAQQNDALRRCSAALNDGSVVHAREALQDAVFHNRQMTQRLGRALTIARHAA